jgi:hypothetical protein
VVGTTDSQTLTNKTLTNPIVGTQTALDNSTKAASTAYVDRTTRDKLTADRTYFVRTDGSDSNNGLANTSGGAFLTIQKAINVVAALDLSIFNVTIQVGAGTYTGGITVNSPWVGSGTVTLSGDTTTPSNCTISTSGACLTVQRGGNLNVQGFKWTTSAGVALLFAQSGGNIITTGLNEFGSCPVHRIYAEGQGQINIQGNEIISGAAGQAHYAAAYGAFIKANSSISWTASGTATQGTFALSQTGIIYSSGCTASGTFAGQRYNASANGVIQTFGGGANYFPGSVAGSTATGGQYA